MSKNEEPCVFLRTGSKIYYVAFYVPTGNGGSKRVARSTRLTDKARAKQLCKRNLARIGFPVIKFSDGRESWLDKDGKLIHQLTKDGKYL